MHAERNTDEVGRVPALPADVVRLVIAARSVAFEGFFDNIKHVEGPGRDALLELDAASEAFASRVPWEDEPKRTLAEQIAADVETVAGLPAEQRAALEREVNPALDTPGIVFRPTLAHPLSPLSKGGSDAE